MLRRFPPPPNSHPASSSSLSAATPSRIPLSTTTNKRSTEAPMEYEWQQPRTIPDGSPFRSAVMSDGERAKKRTHYEAMDIDTPPRPTFPPEATATTNPFGFGAPQPPSSNEEAPHSLPDAKDFDAEKALGLQDEDVVIGDMSMDQLESNEIVIGKEVGLLGNGNSTRRRRGGATTTSSARRRTVSGEKNDDKEEEDEDHEGTSTTTSSRWRPPTKPDFSFQVHHHHSPNSEAVMEGRGSTFAGNTGRWLNSSTPYVLLGYLQFLSLALLAVLFLSLALLFLYTLYVDIQSRLRELTSELRSEILACAKMYVDNRCEPATRLPALERKCAGWEECMGREMVVVGKTRVVAETLAEVVNGFVDVISFKTMFFVVLVLGVCIYGSSVALSLLPLRPIPPPTPPLANHPPHFQHLGYYPPPAGYAFLPPPGQSQSAWNGLSGEKVAASGGGLKAP